MKLYYQNILLLFYAFLFPVFSFSQDSSGNFFRIDKIPPEGILLDKGWKYHAGDNPEWSNPEFDDSQWKNLSPDIDVHHLLKQNKDAGIGWFRLNIKIDSSLQNSSATLIITQVVASEIYLNGKLIYRFGEVDSDYHKERTYILRSQPFNILFGRQKIQDLAIRYSFSPKKFAFFYQTNPCASLIIKNTNQGFQEYNSMSVLNISLAICLISIYLLLALFCLYLYFYFKNEKAYFFIGLYTLAQATSLVFYMIAIDMGSDISFCSYIDILATSISLLGLAFFFKSFYIFFNCGKPRYYYFFSLTPILTILISFVFYDWGLSGVSFVSILTTLEGLRISVKGVMKKRPGAWIILAMICIWLLFETGVLYLNILRKNLEAAYLGAIAFSAGPIFLSFFLAGEFARSRLALQIRAIEVKQLSDKTIAQEQEKQQMLATQNERLETEVQNRTAELNKSLSELKSTQAQLIQSEKMASLGELTAGIAHEIQNPLNFVNNFSEVNNELIEEVKSQKLKLKSEELDEILNDIFQNNEKINHHGKRADAIVKGMLQHSRSSAGKKEPTDINALCDEYLRLAYHGLRAKDKSFNAKFETDLDKSIEKINVVPQEIGRVILNLINNAFYAVNEKQKLNIPGYEPTVIVKTYRNPPSGGRGADILISVADNGKGIPQKVLDKIFQPFFTTKPTGQGTGLGLSLSYDIVTKGHGGELKVETKEGEGSTFIILLP
jgi:signal transduction histidine kinase